VTTAGSSEQRRARPGMRNAPLVRIAAGLTCGCAQHRCTPRYTQTQAPSNYKEAVAMKQMVQQLGLSSYCGLEFWRVHDFACTDVGYGDHAGALKPLELKSAHVQFSNANGRGAVQADLNLTGKTAAKIRAGCDILGKVMGTDEAGQSCIISFLHFSGVADAAALEQLYGDGCIVFNLKESDTARYKFMQQHSFDPQRAEDMDRLRSRLRNAHDAARDAVGLLALRPLWALSYNEDAYCVNSSNFPKVMLMRMMGALLQAHGSGASLAEPAMLAGKVDFLLRLTCGAMLQLQAKTLCWDKHANCWRVSSGCYSDTGIDVLIVADFARNGFYFCPWRVARTAAAGSANLFFTPHEMRARGSLHWNTIRDRFEPFFITQDAAGCAKMLNIAAGIVQDGIPVPPLLPPPPPSEEERMHEAKRIAATKEALRCMAGRPTLVERDADVQKSWPARATTVGRSSSARAAGVTVGQPVPDADTLTAAGPCALTRALESC
jgi:hypothetical protein